MPPNKRRTVPKNTSTNMGMQLRSRWSLRPSAYGSANSRACSQGITGVQVSLRLYLTTSNAPIRNATRAVQTTSAYPEPLNKGRFRASSFFPNIFAKAGAIK